VLQASALLSTSHEPSNDVVDDDDFNVNANVTTSVAPDDADATATATANEIEPTKAPPKRQTQPPMTTNPSWHSQTQDATRFNPITKVKI